MIITVESVAFSYGDNLIFDGVSFAVNEGERIGLIGANGEGKTTLLKLVLGELSPDCGQVVKKERRAHRLPRTERRLFKRQHRLY